MNNNVDWGWPYIVYLIWLIQTLQVIFVEKDHSLTWLVCKSKCPTFHSWRGLRWQNMPQWMSTSWASMTLVCSIEPTRWHTPKTYVQHGTPSTRIIIPPRCTNWRKMQLHFTTNRKLFMANKSGNIFLLSFDSSLIVIIFCKIYFWFALGRICKFTKDDFVLESIHLTLNILPCTQPNMHS